MRLRFSRTADYALRAALEIARTPDGELATRRAVARATNAPPSVVAQALATLVRAQLLVARAGRSGGYRLARPAADISIYDIVSAIDTAQHAERCVLHEEACSSHGDCPFHAVLIAAQERFLSTLRETSLADVLDGATASLETEPHTPDA
ncbi:MAG: Rrf2 family transcriptional regulator [Gaiellales bacterium]